MKYLTSFKRLSGAVVPRHRTARTLLIGLLAAVAVPAGAQVAGAAPGKKPTASPSLCRQYEHVAVKAPKGAEYVVRNDFWGTRRMCLKNSRLRPNFRVTKTSANKIHGNVMSFPYIFRGCSSGVCSRKGRLPARVTKLRYPKATWHAATRASGQWNAALELWFAKRKIHGGQANGAELMIWINTRNVPRASKRIVWVDHTRWYLAKWRAKGHGRSWNYIQFRRVSRRRSVTNLKLWPFIKKAEQKHWIRPWYWMLNIEAGFEIWRGGKGLGTKAFSASP